jgi:hypothetical protein
MFQEEAPADERRAQVAEASVAKKGDGLPGSIPQRSSARNSAKRRSPAQREPGLLSRQNSWTGGVDDEVSAALL